MAENQEIFIAVVVTLLIVWVFFFLAPQQQAEPEKFVVKLDTSQSEFTSELKEEGFIDSPSAFEFWLGIWPGEVKPGSYKLSKEMSNLELVNVLTNQPYQRWVQIPEGLRKEEIAEKVQEKLSWTSFEKEQFLREAKEGRLFPDTYLFKTSYSGKEVAKRMNDRFNEKVDELFDKAEQQNIRNDTLMVLASIVQREAANEEQMPLIAGIIWNRWLNDRLFEIDATLQYALGEPGNWWPKIKPGHKKIDSPYNTYTNKGRPPTPICNPSLAAIEAVIFPEETDYFYYLHDEQGKIHLARTKRQHWRNIDRYLRYPWVYRQKKLHELNSAEINSTLKKLRERFPDKDKRLEALSLLRLGTPYKLGCLGEESEKDQDPIFRVDPTDCTAFVLTNAALLHADSIKQAEQEMRKVNYRSEVSFGERLHFTTDRIDVSPYFDFLTDQMDKNKIKEKQVVLNKIKGDGERLINIGWEKEATVEYVPNQYIDEELLSSLPQSAGVAFVDEDRFKLGLDVVHEGLLFDQRYLIHASSDKDEVEKVNFLDYYFQGEPKFDGIVLYKIL